MDANWPSSDNPPPANVPPMITRTPPSSPPPRRGGGGWKILAIVLLVLAALFILPATIAIVRGVISPKPARFRERPLQEILVEDHASRNKLAVIDVEGIITSHGFDRPGMNMVEFIHRQLRQATRDDRVRAVILRINSPGGEVLAADEIHNALAEFQVETGKPVVAAMGALAASGGYYVAAPAQWIVANELTITGSIGVILQTFNYRGLMEKIGLEPDVYKSGVHKNMLSGARRAEEIPEDEREMVQDLIMETYARFTNIVAAGRSESTLRNGGRGRELDTAWTDYVDGRVFSGALAYELGFVDEVGNFDKAVRRAQILAGITDANLIQYQQPFHFGQLFRLFGESRPAAVKVDIGVEFPKLQPGYLYFITPTVLP